MTTKTGCSTLQIALDRANARLIPAACRFGDGVGRVLHTRIGTDRTGNERAAAPMTAGQTGTATRLRHYLLYTLWFAVPAAGAIVWSFNVTSLGDAHGPVANGLMIVTLGHAALALYQRLRQGQHPAPHVAPRHLTLTDPHPERGPCRPRP